MACRSSSAQKSLMRLGAGREKYRYMQHHPEATDQQHQGQAHATTDTLSSSNSSGELQARNDIYTLQAIARQREQAEGVPRSRSESRSESRDIPRGTGDGPSDDVSENVFEIYPE